jgi:hypothetical protein
MNEPNSNTNRPIIDSNVIQSGKKLNQPLDPQLSNRTSPLLNNPNSKLNFSKKNI